MDLRMTRQLTRHGFFADPPAVISNRDAYTQPKAEDEKAQDMLEIHWRGKSVLREIWWWRGLAIFYAERRVFVTRCI